VKNILALVGGGDRDQVILQTALAAARPLSAHLDFLHVHVPATHAARYSRAGFASGDALRNALDDLDSKGKTFSELAAAHVGAFCASERIEMCDTPSSAHGVSASFREEPDGTIERLIFHARHSDLIVIGRAKQTQGLAPDTLEHLLLNSGRPMLIAASAAPRTLTDTVMVCWKESTNAARAVTVATPLLARAKRVVFASVVERDESVSEALEDLARQFAWNGVSAEVRVIPASSRAVPAALSAAAEDCGADLVVMGAYGRSRARALIFGTCSEAFLDDGDRPMLLMH
jgi:nucleotide-binding universal stress UspA family protein